MQTAKACRSYVAWDLHLNGPVEKKSAVIFSLFFLEGGVAGEIWLDGTRSKSSLIN